MKTFETANKQILDSMGIMERRVLYAIIDKVKKVKYDSQEIEQKCINYTIEVKAICKTIKKNYTGVYDAVVKLSQNILTVGQILHKGKTRDYKTQLFWIPPHEAKPATIDIMIPGVNIKLLREFTYGYTTEDIQTLIGMKTKKKMNQYVSTKFENHGEF